METSKVLSFPIRKVRDSNLELLRILSMLIIIAHHYVVNSTVTECWDYGNITFNMVFLQLAGFGGKMAINVFVLISAYFMCTQTVTWKRILKLLCVVWFYAIIINPVLHLAGYQTLSPYTPFHILFGLFSSTGREFVASFLVFYVLVPVLNQLRKQLSQRQHLALTLFLVLVFSLFYTFLKARSACSYVGWYITLYFIAAYIRLYPNKYTNSSMLALGGVVLSLLSIWGYILAADFFGSRPQNREVYFLCIDSQKIGALLLSLSLFILFKNIRMKPRRFINTLAASAFGVLLIHANSNAMRTWLWQDFLGVPEYYTSDCLPWHCIVSVVGIYLVCAGIDYLRRRYVEKHLMRLIGRLPFADKPCLM